MKNSCRMRDLFDSLLMIACAVMTGCEGTETPRAHSEKSATAPDSAAATGRLPATASRPARGDQTMASFTITSSAFAHNAAVPRKYTGDGQDISPPLNWSGQPEGTRELTLIVDDPDAPTPQPWVHWVLYRIPPETKGLAEGVAPSLRGPNGMLQGKNSWPKVGYGGPAPPRGHGLHHYHFRLYALDAPLGLEPGLTKDAVLKAMAGHILAETTLTGTYQR